jgi:hypothetical protein
MKCEEIKRIQEMDKMKKKQNVLVELFIMIGPEK